MPTNFKASCLIGQVFLQSSEAGLPHMSITMCHAPTPTLTLRGGAFWDVPANAGIMTKLSPCASWFLMTDQAIPSIRFIFDVDGSIFIAV